MPDPMPSRFAENTSRCPPPPMRPLRHIEVWRLQRRLSRVERRLRAVNITQLNHLSPEQQAARAANLDRLHVYWRAGLFPRNTDRLVRVPCFIDRDGRACAVGALIIASGNELLAQRINAAAHNARIRDMAVPGLDGWVAQSGLSVDELAQIQPGYDPAAFLTLFNLVYIPIFLMLTGVNALMTRFNRTSDLRTGWRMLAPVLIGFVGAGLAVFILAGTAQFILDMTRYFFGMISLTDIAGYNSMMQPATQSAMALPLIILIAGVVLTTLFAVRAVVSGLRVIQRL